MELRAFDYTTADYERYVALRNSVITDQPASVAFERRTDEEWPDGELRRRALVLGDDGRTLAAADFYSLLWSESPGKFGFMIFVREDARRQGLGDRLYRYILSSLAPHQPQGLETMTREDWPDGVRFLEKRGFRMQNRQQQSEIDLTTFEPAQFADLMDAVAASGIALKTLDELLAADPGALRKLYGLEMETLPDLPWYDDLTIRPFEEWAVSYKDNPDLLPGGYIVALDGTEPVGLSQLWASEATDRLLYTGLTAVRSPYRHRGLATAMKVRALQYAQSLIASDGKPPRVVTANEENNPMLQINLRLGFKERPAWLIYYR